MSHELQKAEALGYTVLKFHEVWHYKNTTQYDHTTGKGGLFAEYMNAFIGLKMQASGYPSHVITDEDKEEFVRQTKEVEGVTLDPTKIKHNPGARAVAKLCLNNMWGKLAQRSNMSKAAYLREPREFFDLLTSDAYEVNECELINDECIYVTYKFANGFEEPTPNTNAVVASYVTAHARLELYSYLEKLGERVLYCDTDSIIYKSSPDGYEPPLSNHIGGMTDELGGQFIKEFISNGPKTYGYRTSGEEEVIKCKGFTLNKKTSDQLTFDVMKELAIGEEEAEVKINQGYKINADVKRRRIWSEVDTKTYRRTFDKRVITPNHSSVPYGYIAEH